MTEPVRAIDTKYRGFLFRSRLEARWAVFLDHLSVGFRYEMEGFEFGRDRYLPDFYLPRLDCWIEIKPLMPRGDDRAVRLATALADATNKIVYIFAGDLVCPSDQLWYQQDGGQYPYAHALACFPLSGADWHYLWCECSTCHSVGIHFDGRSDRLKCKGDTGCPQSPHGDKGYAHDTPRLRAAYDAARSARFEGREAFSWKVEP